MHVAEHCITDLKSLKAVVRARKLKEISVPIDVYKRIRCEDRGIEINDDRRWSFGGYVVWVDLERVQVEVRR